MISFTCSCCGGKLTVPDDWPCKEFPCPDCGLLTLLASPAMTDNVSWQPPLPNSRYSAPCPGARGRVCTDSPDAAVPPACPSSPAMKSSAN